MAVEDFVAHHSEKLAEAMAEKMRLMQSMGLHSNRIKLDETATIVLMQHLRLTASHIKTLNSALALAEAELDVYRTRPLHTIARLRLLYWLKRRLR